MKMRPVAELLMDKVIKQYGMNNEWVIWFCQLCEDERITDEMLFLAKEEVEKNIFKSA